MKLHFHTLNLAWAVVLLLCASAAADLPSPRFDRLTPLGAAAGSSVEAEIAGGDLEDIQTILFDHPGITATPVAEKERRFQIAIAADVPAGTYDALLVGRFGISNPRLFCVTRGLANVSETEPDNNLPAGQWVERNALIAAMSDGNGEDIFRFSAAEGERLVLEVRAGNLDSALDATMTLTNETGQLLQSSSDYNGRDPLIDFVAPATGDYLVRIADLSFRGGHPYLLLISDKPHVENVFPCAIQAGQSAELVALGRNLGPSAAASAWQIDERPLAEFRFMVQAPADLACRGGYQFLTHPTDHSDLPTAATCTLTGFQTLPSLPDATGAQPLLVCDSPVTVEAEPNDRAEMAQAVGLPLVVCGRFGRPRDIDFYEFQVAEAGQYSFQVYCERIRGRADPYLVVVDDQGKRVQELDDFGHRINAFDGHLRDPVGMIQLAENRKYRVLVQDRYQRGGARYQYVLAIHKPQPDFYVAAIHGQNPGPAGTTIWRGGAQYLDLVIHQCDGFNQPVKITAAQLPPGVHCAPTVINNNSRGVVVLWADESAPEAVGPVRLVAEAVGIAGDSSQPKLAPHEVRPYSRVSNNGGGNSSRSMRELVVATRNRAPFWLEFAADQIQAEAGQTVEVSLRLVRRWDGFASDVNILPLSFPGNFKMANATLFGNQQELVMKIEVQPNTAPGDYTLAVLGQAQVPFNKDPAAADRPNTLVSLPSKPVTLQVTAPLPVTAPPKSQ